MKKIALILVIVLLLPITFGVLAGTGKLSEWFDKETEEEDPFSEEFIEPHPEYMPDNVNGERKYATYKVISFDEADKQQALGNYVNVSDCGSGYVEGEISSRAFSISNGSQKGMVAFNLSHTVDITPYEGFLFYFDATGVKTPIDNKTGVTLRIYSEDNPNGYSVTRNDQFNAPGVSEIAFYYQEGGNKEWLKSTELWGDRGMFPADYKGWIYIPFTSFVTSSLPDGSGAAAGIYGADKVNKIECYVGPYSLEVPGENTVVVDEISLVKFGVNQRDWSIPDMINDYHDYNNVALAYAGGYGTYGNEPLEAGKEVIVAVHGIGDVTLSGLVDSEEKESDIKLSFGDTRTTRIVTGTMGGLEELSAIGDVKLQIFAKLDISKYSDIEVSSFMNFAANDSVISPYKFTMNVEAGKHYGIRVNSFLTNKLDSPMDIISGGGILTEIYGNSVTVGDSTYPYLLYCFEATDTGVVTFSLNTKDVRVNVYEMPYVNYNGYVYLKTDYTIVQTSKTIVNSDGTEEVYEGYLIENLECLNYYVVGAPNLYKSIFSYVSYGDEIFASDGNIQPEIYIFDDFSFKVNLMIEPYLSDPQDLFFGCLKADLEEDLSNYSPEIYRIIGTF